MLTSLRVNPSHLSHAESLRRELDVDLQETEKRVRAYLSKGDVSFAVQQLCSTVSYQELEGPVANGRKVSRDLGSELSWTLRGRVADMAGLIGAYARVSEAARRELQRF